MQITLNKKQFEYFNATDILTIFVGGLGCGKTFVNSLLLLNLSKLQGAFNLFTSNNNNQLKYMLNELVSVWAGLGYFFNQDYVINQAPPKQWKVEPYSIKDNKGILTTKWGSYVQIKESFQFNTFRSSEFDNIIYDELRDSKEGAVDVLVGRLRGKASKAAGQQSLFRATTTPFDNIARLNDYKNKGAKIIESTTSDNLENLPVGYIDFQKQILDERTYRREILGENIPPTNTIFYNFSEDNICDVVFNPNKDLILSFDFNVSPMTCLLFQDNICVYEFQEYESNTQDTANKIKRFLRNENFKGSLEITGDPSGNNRSTSNPYNNYQLLLQELAEFAPKLKTFVRQGRIYGQNVITSALKTTNGTIKVKFNKDCKQLINNIGIVTERDYELKDPHNVTHNIDALRYYCVHYLPIQQRKEVYGF